MNVNKLISLETKLDGVLLIGPRKYDDNRGYYSPLFNGPEFKRVLGIDFNCIQFGRSWNKEVGVTRGIHQEPWNKLIIVTTGQIFAAIVDLRDCDTYGRYETFSIGAGGMLYVPQGYGNAFQATEPTLYDYLVTGDWVEGAPYRMVNLLDEDLAIDWPIKEMNMSDKDRNHPPFSAHNPALYWPWKHRLEAQQAMDRR